MDNNEWLLEYERLKLAYTEATLAANYPAMTKWSQDADPDEAERALDEHVFTALAELRKDVAWLEAQLEDESV